MRQHRSSSYSHTASGGNALFSNPKFWITAILTIIIVWWLYGLATSSAPTGNATGLIVGLNGSGSEVVLTDTKGQTTSIDQRTPLDTSIQKITVKKGEGLLSSSAFTLILGNNAEMKYEGNANSGVIVWSTGKGWLETTATTSANLRNITTRVYTGSTVFISQNTISSSITILVGSAMVKANDSSTTLTAGNTLTILNSDVTSASLSVIDKIEPINETTEQDSFFVTHKGNIEITTTDDGSGDALNTSSGTTTLTSSGTLLSTTSQFIEISTPTDESTVTTASIDVAGKILNPIVTRVTVNDQEATVSPVEMTFALNGLTITESTTNIVYKAFDAQKNLLQKSVITVYANPSSITQTTRPSVTTYPVSDENFKIIAPTENPYKTTEDVIQIQGSVPANIVKYITVNNFRLTKFIPYSTTWYYFANKEYNTMNEGINEYTIQYFDANDQVLSTGKFIIVKETPQVVTDNALLQ